VYVNKYQEKNMNKVTRRNWVKVASAAGAGVCLCGGTGGCATFSKVGSTPPITKEAYTLKNKKILLKLDKVQQLSTVGGAVKIIDPQLPTPVIIARAEGDAYHVVSLLCPHRNVEVEYQHADKQFRCASLGHSKFKTDGTLKKGLTQKALSHYEASLDPADKNCLVVTL
jgi:nitrite reductase/ring-hydroxylating ferredoxin subunit